MNSRRNFNKSNINYLKKYFSLFYLERHPSNYLVISGKYPIHHILFTRR
jgi:hypothetical protein